MQGKGPRSGAMWTRRRRSCGHEMDPAAPLEKTSAGAFGVYDPSAHGPRLFDGPAGGPQRVCVLCMLERERWCRRQRDAELGFVAGMMCDAQRILEPTMTERDVLAGELESANQRISHLQVQVEQVIAPRLSSFSLFCPSVGTSVPLWVLSLCGYVRVHMYCYTYVCGSVNTYV